MSKSPTKLFEYMAAGLVPISTDVGEASHVLKNHENGILCEGTADSFRDAINWLADNKRKMHILGTNARKTVEEGYSIQVLSAKLDRILKENL